MGWSSLHQHSAFRIAGRVKAGIEKVPCAGTVLSLLGPHMDDDHCQGISWRSTVTPRRGFR